MPTDSGPLDLIYRTYTTNNYLFAEQEFQLMFFFRFDVSFGQVIRIKRSRIKAGKKITVGSNGSDNFALYVDSENSLIFIVSFLITSGSINQL